jgi:hypothetical protein
MEAFPFLLPQPLVCVSGSHNLGEYGIRVLPMNDPALSM